MSRTSRATIVSPHPDDEVFGVGGLIRELVRRRCTVRVVAVTDGEAAFGDRSPDERRALVEQRCTERADAFAHLGVANRVEVVRLRLPDGALADHQDELADRLTTLAGTVMLATWRGDGHPDHEAVGRAAATAAARSCSRLLEYPVWAAERGRLPAIGSGSPLHIRHSPATMAAKQRAVCAFRSQLEPSPDGRPVVPASLVQRLATADEVLFG